MEWGNDGIGEGDHDQDYDQDHDFYGGELKMVSRGAKSLGWHEGLTLGSY